MEMKQLLIKINLILLFFISCSSDSNRAEQSVLPTPTVKYVPGEIASDIDGYIQYYVGNTPIIITVPHGGEINPSIIPDRNGESEKSENTIGIAQYFYTTFTSGNNNLYPHIIINNIDRAKLDPDTNIESGAQSNYSTIYYNRYHNYIQAAVDSTEEYFDVGMLVNLVGHKDDSQKIELGYLVSLNDLNQSDTALSNSNVQTSINSIASLSSSTLAETIRGFDSVGGKIMDLSCCKPIYYTFDVTPSPDFPIPDNDDYNIGRYTLLTYGSQNSISKISAIEFSTPFLNHRDSPYALIALGAMLVEGVQHLYEQSTGLMLGL